MASDAPSAARPLAPEVPGVEALVLVGRGGHGLVYRGRQPEMGRDVAVKLLSTPAPDERAVERWRREVTAMGRLSNHPGIITVLSEGVTADGHPYLVMPFLPGGSLHDRIQARGPLPPAEVVEVGRRLASALAAAHAAGVVHRDVKPANVMFTEYDEPQLGDLGIARLVDAATTATGSVHATLEYAAPEVLSGQAATPASDVYGLGATLHAALAGSSPFAGPADEPLAARVSRVVTQPAPDLRPAGVPPGVAAVVEQCMAKDPADRPSSADEVGELLAGVSLDPGGPQPTEVVAAAVVPPTASLDATAVQVPVGGPSPTAVAAPAGPAVAPAPSGPVSPPLGAPQREGTGRRGLALAAGLVLLFIAAAGLAWALARDDEPSAREATTTTTTEAPTTEAPATTTSTPETTAATTTPTTASTTAATSTPATSTAETGTPSREEVRAAVDAYYDQVAAGDAAGAWDLLSPAYQARQGEDEYLAFWDSVESVAVRGRPRVDEDGGPAEATLVFRMEDGRTSVEDVVIGVVRGDDGSLLIDSYEVVRAR